MLSTLGMFRRSWREIAPHRTFQQNSFLNVETETTANRPNPRPNHTGANSKDGKVIYDILCARDRVPRCSRIGEMDMWKDGNVEGE